MRVHLIDGTYELFRAFFGAPPARAKDGRDVGAVVGLMRSLLAMLRDPDVTHVACAFDTEIESFRNELFEGYKTGEGIDPALLAQFPLAERVARALGIVTWSMVEFEADDALATAALRGDLDGRVEQVVLCTPDKDLAQCVSGDRIVMLDRRRRIVLDEAAVAAKFGVRPASIPDWLALVGDSADGIPGIPRWGAKSSAVVLARYGTIEAIPDDVADWDVAVRGAASLARELHAARAQALLYKRLATLRRDVPLAEDVGALCWTPPRDKGLAELCYELDVAVPRLADR